MKCRSARTRAITEHVALEKSESTQLESAQLNLHDNAESSRADHSERGGRATGKMSVGMFRERGWVLRARASDICIYICIYMCVFKYVRDNSIYVNDTREGCFFF